MTWVGRSVPRSEDPRLLQGLGAYFADMAAGALRIRFVRSPIASGRLNGVERPPAGLVYTAADVGDIRPLRPLLHRPDYVAVDQPVLAVDRLLFVGQPVAAVIADSQEAAEDLADQVFIDCDADTALVDVDIAAADGARPVHQKTTGNVLVEGKIETPGYAAARAGARHVVSIDIVSRRQNAAPMEPRGGVAQFDRASGRVRLTCSVQMPHMLRTGIADCLGMPEADLQVVAPDVGGGFGQKMALVPEYLFLVWAARKLRRTVAWVEDRRENLTSAFHSRDQRHKITGSFDENGRLVALEGDIRCNIGAFSVYPITCGVEPLMAMAELPGPYDFRDYKVRSRGVTTNTCPMAPYRGVSRPVLTLSVERLMDVAARRIGIEPAEIRRRNLIREFPYKSATGISYDEGSYLQSLARAETLVDLPGFRSRQQQALTEGRFIGLGFSVFNERSGYGTPAFAARSMDITPGYETVEIAMDPSGVVEARIGASPHGQGLATGLSQIVADILGVTPSDVRIVHGDTDRTPYGWGTFASRSMVISGGAVKLAAEALRGKVLTMAGKLLQAPVETISLANGRATAAPGGASIEITRIARLAYHQSQQFKGDVDNGLRAVATYDPPGTYSNACHAVIVEVDIETGMVRIDRFVAVEDAGLIINPTIADGQVHGGIAQGIANALYEEIAYDGDGNILTGSLADFLWPTANEIPSFEIEHLVTITAASETKAKGLGEGGSIGAPAAILNAIADALRPLGVEPLEMPMSPMRLHALIAEARQRTPA